MWKTGWMLGPVLGMALCLPGGASVSVATFTDITFGSTHAIVASVTDAGVQIVTLDDPIEEPMAITVEQFGIQ